MGDSMLNMVEDSLATPKSLILLRIRLLENDGPGLSLLFLSVIQQAIGDWIDILKSGNSAASLMATEETKQIIRVLTIYNQIATLDATLNEELGLEGSHFLLSKIIKVDATQFDVEEDQDTVMEVQDMACEIATTCPSFPIRVAPLTPDELKARLPLSFPIFPVDTTNDTSNEVDQKSEEEILILINQVSERQSSQADVGFLMWPSAVVLSRWLVSNPSILHGKTVLELGAGCGLTGLVAGRLIANTGDKNNKVAHSSTVLLTDFNPTVVKNCNQNISLNGLKEVAKAEGLDFYQQDVSMEGWLDSNGKCRTQVDLVLAADVICQPEDAFATARTMACALKPGGKGIVVSADSKHRFGVERLEEACAEVGLQVSKSNVRDLYGGTLLSSNMEKTTGYVEGMSLTMYVVEKSA